MAEWPAVPLKLEISGSNIEVGGHYVDSYSLSEICITSVNLLISSILHK